MQFFPSAAELIKTLFIASPPSELSFNPVNKYQTEMNKKKHLLCNKELYKTFQINIVSFLV